MPFHPKEIKEKLNDPKCDHGESIKAEIEEHMKHALGDGLFERMNILESIEEMPPEFAKTAEKYFWELVMEAHKQAIKKYRRRQGEDK